ncbi:MAG: hypothetical protein Q8904_04140 [Bacteroidota bacterium]|nr:hypothetical protein [Bacteroidota bacterium]
MFYNHNLRANIQEWRSRFVRSDFSLSVNNFQFLFDKLQNEGIIKNIFNELVIKYPYSEEKLLDMIKKGIDRYKFENEIEHASFNYQLCCWIIDKGKDFRYLLDVGRDYNDTLEYFKDNIVSPLLDYIHDQLDKVSHVLYILEKYKLRTEWFTRKDLLAKYKSADKSYEELLEEDLRLFLFDQGINYPFSTPKSASGRADVVSLIDTSDPLVLEIKIYDSSKGYRKERIQGGFAQTVKYTHDYHKDTGYLVVFNMDNLEIEIEGKEADNKWPNRFIFNSKTYYIIFINMNSDVSASKQGVLKKETVLLEELIKDI